MELHLLLLLLGHEVASWELQLRAYYLMFPAAQLQHQRKERQREQEDANSLAGFSAAAASGGVDRQP
jgi:hypothetical protein